MNSSSSYSWLRAPWDLLRSCGLAQLARRLGRERVFKYGSTEERERALNQLLPESRSIPNSELCRAFAVENSSWLHIARLTPHMHEGKIG